MIGLNRSSSECVELSFVSLRTQARLAGLSAGCERLVHPSVGRGAERARQGRLIALLLAAPFVVGAAAVQALAGLADGAALAAGLCGFFGACWMAALIVASTGGRTGVEAAVLACATLATGVLVAAAGGLASPLALLAGALAVESYWVGRSRGSMLLGGAAVLTALALAGAVAFAPLPIAEISAAQWIIPAAYAVALWLRLGGFQQEMPAHSDGDGTQVEALLDAVVIRLGMGGDVQEVSAQARRMLDVQPELLLGGGLFERVHVADRLIYMTALADLREGAAARQVEVRLRLPASAGAKPAIGYRDFAIEFRLPSLDSDVIVAILRDNAEMVDLRHRLAAAEDKAESDDLAKSRFLAAVSHELRTPLNAIIGFSDMLLHEIYGGFTDPRQKEYAGLIRESGNHLLSVVNSILDVSKIESGAYSIHPEPFAFAKAAEMCRSMMAHQAEAKAIRLEDRVAANAGDICGDRRAVQQILINLVSNAVKFTPEGGDVVIGAKRLGSRLVFWVSDTGIGIAGEDLERLGQPFMQIQNDFTRRYDGTGLGLSLVKGLVTLHDGSMSIESAPGQGTTVTVSLPVDGPKLAETRGALVAMTVDRTMEAGDEAYRKTA